MPFANVLPTSLLCVLSDSGATLATPPGPTWQYVPPVVPPLSLSLSLSLQLFLALFFFFSSCLTSVFASMRLLSSPSHHHGHMDAPTYTVGRYILHATHTLTLELTHNAPGKVFVCVSHLTASSTVPHCADGWLCVLCVSFMTW